MNVVFFEIHMLTGSFPVSLASFVGRKNGRGAVGVNEELGMRN